jgi:D-glycero-D-manno-heptose 1,7-bisphosphate phosphatase
LDISGREHLLAPARQPGRCRVSVNIGRSLAKAEFRQDRGVDQVKAAFLDRDGVINLDTGYVHRWDEFVFAPGAIAAMRDLQTAGFMLIVVTNQAGIARGYYSTQQFETLTAQMLGHLESEGVRITAVYHCPHHPAGSVPALSIDCDCRKPAPGMLLAAAREHGLSLANSILIGDKPSDIGAAQAAGIGRAYMVESDNIDSVSTGVTSDGVFASLPACIDHILGRA